MIKTKINKNRKYIFVVGGVMSGVGKGIVTATVGNLLQARGLTVTAVKVDQYFNVDAGTMNPTEHGEVFVMKSGLETDQDMGNYERFLDKDLPAINYMTSGSIYSEVIRKERNLEYKGKNVEAVPDIPNEFIRRVKKAGDEADADVTIIEIGGTVGEYQNVLYLEAIRMMKSEMPDDIATILVSFLPVPKSIGEMKTKPTQYAARTLNATGVFADMIIARAPVNIDKKRREKIARFCNVKAENVISAPDVDSIYDVPLNFEKDGVSSKLCSILNIKKCSDKSNMKEWKKFIASTKNTKNEVKIAVIGKYFNSGDFMISDVYISILEAIKFSAYSLGVKAKIDYISAQDFEDMPTSKADSKNLKKLSKYDGILIPGGFGITGIEGKINAIKYVRENKIPYFGICYGMQLMVVEYARNVLGIKDATTREIDPRGKHLVIDIMDDQKERLASKDYGGTMRLGSYPAHLHSGTIARRAYGVENIEERHRHRYEVNPTYIAELTGSGLKFSGVSPDGKLMEIAELPKSKHPFMLGTQFHPELQARPLRPHPLFTAFIKATLKNNK